MKLVKSLLLGSAAALVAGAGAQAADLPARKAAPVEYVKVCDAYGAGFFYIPGTDTCLKVGGRVRADFSMSQRGNVFGGTNAFTTAGAGTPTVTTTTTTSTTSGGVTTTGTTTSTTPGVSGTGAQTGVAAINPISGATFNPLLIARDSQNLYGWEARGRVDLDARTQTAWGTVQAVASLRLARTTGVLAETGPSLSSSSANPTLEAAYIRFAGFTFGAARDNFAFMPSTFYGSGHWASFANGAKQIAYTAVLGGGISATVAIQDATDTTNGALNARGFFDANGNFVDVRSTTTGGITTFAFAPTSAGLYAYNAFPQVNGRIDLDQGWGSASVMGAVGSAVNDTATGDTTNGAVPVVRTDLNTRKTVWALGAGVKINLPMIAAGDVLWLNGGYAQGMTEYTVNWTYFKSSDTRRNTAGFINQAPSWVNTLDAAGNAQIETLKSWNLAALYTHYWTPEWRHSFLVTGGKVEGTATSRALTFGSAGAFGDQRVWNIGTQLAWLPTRNFEIGVDVLYNRVSQDVRRLNGTTSATGVTTPTGGTTVTKESTNGWTGRLRVERTF